MTREERKFAKSRIEYLLKISSFVFDEHDKEALEIAIQALSQDPCDDAIDRAEAMTEIMMFAGNVKPDEEDIYIKVSDAVQLLRELPSVTQKSGKWDRSCTCSVCGKWRILESEKNSGKYKYCPNCGAYMREEQTDVT